MGWNIRYLLHGYMYIILHVALDISEKSYGLLEIDLITSVFTS